MFKNMKKILSLTSTDDLPLRNLYDAICWENDDISQNNHFKTIMKNVLKEFKIWKQE
jgi:hypothetical protein